MNSTSAISQSAQTTRTRDLPLVAKKGPQKCARRAGRFTNGAQVLEVCEGNTPCFARRLRARRAPEGTCVVNRVFIAEQIRKNLLDKAAGHRGQGTEDRRQEAGGRSQSPTPGHLSVASSHRPIGGWKPPLRLQSFTSP